MRESTNSQSPANVVAVHRNVYYGTWLFAFALVALTSWIWIDNRNELQVYRFKILEISKTMRMWKIQVPGFHIEEIKFRDTDRYMKSFLAAMRSDEIMSEEQVRFIYAIRKNSAENPNSRDIEVGELFAYLSDLKGQVLNITSIDGKPNSLTLTLRKT